MPRKKKQDPDLTPPATDEEPEEISREGNIVTLSLPAKLTQEQRAAYGDRLGELHNQLEQLDDEKQQALDLYKVGAEPIEEEMEGLLKKLGAGEELHEVKCCLEFDLSGNEATYRRLDTGEVARTRAITADELEAARQGKLPMPGDGA